MYRLENIKIRENLSEKEILEKACKQYKIKLQDIAEYKIFRCSIDARNKEDIFFNISLDIELKNRIKYKKLKEIKIEKEELIKKIERKSAFRPVIVGAGPSGLFCALILAYNGLKPILIEQGKSVSERQKDVDEFLKTGKLNITSNVQFGEGGAGTFSDGKLTTGINNKLCRNVLEEFVKFGAPKEILILNKPHIGTDNLVKIVENIRKEIIKLGGEVLFESKFVDFELENNKLKKVLYLDLKNNKIKKMATDTLVLAIGHSARDTFEKLYEKGLEMQKKNFSVGVRIEHKQDMINYSQYGNKTKLKLPPAEYKLAYHGKNHSCYTFCMCPGGKVIASSSEEGTIVTNGMSKFARDGENANSAILVDVKIDDIKGESPLEGMYFQKDLEKKAFELGGKNYNAPIQKVEDFLCNRKTENLGQVKPTYLPSVTFADLNTILPDFISETLKEGILYFDKKLKGFASPDSILTGVETRSSSPVKIVRGDNFMSNVIGIYPIGEGAGYAGGIMSASVDGKK